MNRLAELGKEGPGFDAKEASKLFSRPNLQYVLALLALAVGSIASHFVLAQSIEKLDEDSLAINTSGRQRMLSEQTFRLAGEIVTVEGVEENRLVSQQLRASLSLMRKSHEELAANARQQVDLPLWDQKLRTAYFDGSPSLDDRLHDYFEAFDALLLAKPQSLSAKQDSYRQIVQAHQRGLLGDLDDVVKIYEGKAQARLAWSERLHVVLMLAMLALLAFVALFIFRPLVRRQAAVNIVLRGARDEAQAELAARTSILAAVSHEIRTPLGGVLGIIDQLKRERSPVERERALELVEDSCEALLDTLDGILQQSRLAQGADTLSQKTFSPRSIAQRVAELFRPVARRKALVIEVSASSERKAVGDDARLQQVLANLVSNSVKFTQSGAVSISVEEPKSGSNEWTFLVTDTGSGMDERRVKGLFEPFGHSSDDTLGRNVGAGLGLSITRDLVKAMGGRVEVESTLGKGSVFTVLIPLEEPLDSRKEDAALTQKGSVALLIDRASDRVQAEAVAVQNGFDVFDLGALNDLEVPKDEKLIVIVEAALYPTLSDRISRASARIIVIGDKATDPASSTDNTVVYVSHNQLVRLLGEILERPLS